MPIVHLNIGHEGDLCIPVIIAVNTYKAYLGGDAHPDEPASVEIDFVRPDFYIGKDAEDPIFYAKFCAWLKEVAERTNDIHADIEKELRRLYR